MNLTLTQASKLARCSLQTLYNAFDAGDLETWKEGRSRMIDRVSFDAWLANRRVPDGYCGMTEAAALLHVAEHAIRQAVYAGDITWRRGRYNKYLVKLASLEAWAEQRRIPNCRRCGLIAPLDEEHLCGICMHEQENGNRTLFYWKEDRSCLSS